MKQIGMVVAVEMDAVLARYGMALTEKRVSGFRVMEYQGESFRLTIVHCGAGEIAAAAATQLLISEYRAELIVNFGVVGGLTPEMAKTKVCIVDKVVHYAFDTSAVDHIPVGRYLQYPDVYIPATHALVEQARGIYPQLTPVICASADRFVDKAEEKRELHEIYGAHICEMEAAGIVLTCDRAGVPCLLLKIVSDGITGGAEEFQATKVEAANICMDLVDRILPRL